MCSIFGIISKENLDTDIIVSACKLSNIMKHRGPDGNGYKLFENAILVHERLAIVNLESGSQPFLSDNEEIALIANCEIYNYIEISQMIEDKIGMKFVTRSDADVLLYGYKLFGTDILKYIRGMYAFIIYDSDKNIYFVARDPIGIIPLYYGMDKKGRLIFSSEMKSFREMAEEIFVFPPGSFIKSINTDLSMNGIIKYYLPNWITDSQNSVDLEELKNKLTDSVKCHLMGNVPIVSLLSGGLDSSLIAGIASKFLKEKNETLRTYSIGLEGSPDLLYAKEVADYIGSIHNNIIYTIKDGLAVIKDIIWHLESYDVTTIRASIPMYLAARKIKEDGFKVTLSGEGADEIFGGYLYFHQAPSAEEFHKETVSRVLNLSYSDCLRANKSTLACGVELRVPFLDTDFINYSMNISPEYRMISSKLDGNRKIEKYILRQAFYKENIIPQKILWRQKEQFSDGVGYEWIDALKENGEKQVSDDIFERAKEFYPVNTPLTKEAFYYRTIYNDLFGSCGDKTVQQWIPRVDWGCLADPSGRAQKVHLNCNKLII